MARDVSASYYTRRIGCHDGHTVRTAEPAYSLTSNYMRDTIADLRGGPMRRAAMRSSMTALVGCGLILAGIVATAQSPAGEATAPAAGTTAHRDAMTFSGDTALWSVAIKPDKTQDFEHIMIRLRQALQESKDPDRQRQAAGWKVVRLDTPLPNGSVVYLHMIHPVVPGADYSVMRALYDAFPDERLALYEQYRNAFDRNVSLAKGTVSVDLSTNATQSASVR
jgi:hypothetical protein